MDDINKRKLNILNSDLEALEQISGLLENIFKVDQQLSSAKKSKKLKKHDLDLDYQHVTDFAVQISEEIKKTREEISLEKNSILGTSRKKDQLKIEAGPSAIEEQLVCKATDLAGRCVDNQCPIERIKNKVFDFKVQAHDSVSAPTLEKFTKMLDELEKMRSQVTEMEEIADSLTAFSNAFEKVPSRRTSIAAAEATAPVNKAPQQKNKLKKLFGCCFSNCCSKEKNKDEYEVISGENRA